MLPAVRITEVLHEVSRRFDTFLPPSELIKGVHQFGGGSLFADFP